MNTVHVRLKNWFRRAIYMALIVSWCSGVLFYIMNNWITVEGEFGPEKHPWQFFVLATHGFSAFFLLMMIGSMFTNHIPMAWKTKRSRRLGITLTTVFSIQFLTAYMLYYSGLESLRVPLTYVHLINGLLIPVILFLHIWSGRKINK